MSPQFSAAIGVIGFKAAGKDTLCRYLIDRHGFGMVSTGDLIRTIARRDGHPEPSTALLQDIGDRYRRESGDNGYWMHRLVEEARRRGIGRLVLNGIRNPVEVEALKQVLGRSLVLVGVVAPFVERARRFTERFPEISTLEEFAVIDDRDRGVGEPPEGQQVDRALASVPFERVYLNTGSSDELYAWADTIVART